MTGKPVCPQCGCEEIGRGRFAGDVRLFPQNKAFTLGSRVEADVCTDCGYIVSIRVENPERFKEKS